MSNQSGQHTPHPKSALTELHDLQEPIQDLARDQADQVLGGDKNAPKEPYLQIKLTDTTISSYNTSG